jgi:SAM-dependent methyltransferase
MISDPLISAIRTHEAGALLGLLRSVYMQQETRGAAIADPGTASALATAQSLGLIEPTDPSEARLKLTASGYTLGNFAKEYCNWIDSGRRAPESVTADLIAGRRLLDVGCSFGRHLATFRMLGAHGVGIDLEETYIELSRVFAAREGIPLLPVARAEAQHLPFRDRSFDVVFCRLVVNYVPVRETLSEFARVLVPGGRLIIAFGTFGEGVDFIRRARWRGNLRTIAWRGFGLVNTIALQTIGRQMSIRARGRMYAVHTPTWPTRRWMGRELLRQGFVAPAGGFQAHAVPAVYHAIRADVGSSSPL